MRCLPRLGVLCGLVVCLAHSAFGQNPPGPRTLYLIRHGFYDYDAQADSKTGNPLNALGREQAAFVAERLAALPVKFAAVTSSELTRARETGDLIAARLGLPCGRDAHLNEVTPAGAGVKPEQIDAHAETQLEAAWQHFATPAPTANGSHELLVCHGNLIRWLVCRALGVDPQRWTQMEIANGSITMIQVRPDGTTRVQQFNEIAHVPVAKQTWSGRGPDWPLAAQPRAK